MDNSKLLDLMRTFSPREWRAFQDMVGSAYFNRNADLHRLTTWLHGYAPSLEGVTRAAAHASLFPDSPPDEARLNHLMSFLLKLAEDFIGLETYWKQPYTPAYHTLAGLSTRGLDKHYRFHLEKTRRGFQQNTAPGGAHFFQQYNIEILEAERLTRNSPRQFNASVQIATDSLDAFYLLEKLRRTCYMFTSQAVVATPYNLQLVEEICRFVGTHLDDMAAPAIEAYFRIIQLLTKDDPHADFQALKVLLREKAAFFSPEDLTDVYQYAINFCNIQIQKVQGAYIAEAFDLYTKAVDTGILLEQGRLSPWHFKNIIALALRLKKHAWTEQFIHQTTTQLAPEYQADALHYNLALLFYNTNRRAEAMEYLNKVEFTDIHYSLGAKLILCQIYHQNDDFDALESLLHAFHTFLRRNKLIAENTRQAYLNFILIMRKILRAQPRQYTDILRETEKMQLLVAKEWLVNILQ